MVVRFEARAAVHPGETGHEGFDFSAAHQRDPLDDHQDFVVPLPRAVTPET